MQKYLQLKKLNSFIFIQRLWNAYCLPDTCTDINVQEIINRIFVTKNLRFGYAFVDFTYLLLYIIAIKTLESNWCISLYGILYFM